jgi:enoyl-CoA hydratase
MSAMSDVLLSIEGHVATVTLHHEARYNAMTLGMWNALGDALDKLHADANVRAVVLRGAGDKAFVSGADISEFATQRNAPDGVQAYDLAVKRAQTGITRLRCPVVAAISGICYLRYGAPNARFRMPAGRLGLGYALDGVKRMVDVLGQARAAEFFYTARVCDAQQALAMGLLNQVDTDVFAYAKQIASEIADNAPLTLVAGKLAINTVLDGGLQSDAQDVDAAVKACFTSLDYAEGRAAFSEKRAPRFTGR